MKMFDERRKSLPKLLKQYAKMQIGTEEHKELGKLIDDIENDHSLNDYLLKAAEFFKAKQPTNTTTSSSSSINNNNGRMSQYVSVNVSDNKGEHYENYLNAIGEDTSIAYQRNYEEKFCNVCHSDNFCFDDISCTRTCLECSTSVPFLDQSTNCVSYEQRVDIQSQSTFVYKKENHFFEWLAQIQAKENTEVPKDVFDQIFAEIKKQRCRVETITSAQIRKFLKKLHFNRYYEHAPAIACAVSGRQPVRFPRELEETLVVMFKEIQRPWANWVGIISPERKNFLSYSYVLYKFCELLEKDEYLSSFSLLKSRQKLHQHDCLWQKICEELNWQFIPST